MTNDLTNAQSHIRDAMRKLVNAHIAAPKHERAHIETMLEDLYAVNESICRVKQRERIFG